MIQELKVFYTDQNVDILNDWTLLTAVCQDLIPKTLKNKSMIPLVSLQKVIF